MSLVASYRNVLQYLIWREVSSYSVKAVASVLVKIKLVCVSLRLRVAELPSYIPNTVLAWLAWLGSSGSAWVWLAFSMDFYLIWVDFGLIWLLVFSYLDFDWILI